MNDNHGARPGLLACVLAGAALLAAACGGSTSSTGSSPYAKALAYSQCMRANGVPNYPDPDSQGLIPFDARDLGVGTDSPQFLHARKTCAKLAPNISISAQQERQVLAQAIKYAACLRAHGLPDYPDPSTAGGGVEVDLPASIRDSPDFSSAQQACRSLSPAAAP
jgi:hypothetical protein